MRSTLMTLALAAAAMPRTAAARPPVTTLDEISIEGEVRLPRVLFITSRDPARPMDFLDLYTPTVSAVADVPTGAVPVLDPSAEQAAAATPPEARVTTDPIDRSPSAEAESTSEEVRP